MSLALLQPVDSIDSELYGPLSAKDLEQWIVEAERALAIHIRKERVRRGLWKDYPAKNQFNQIKVKIDRVLRSMEILEHGDLSDEEAAEFTANILEEMYDITNYSIFGTRQLRGEF